MAISITTRVALGLAALLGAQSCVATAPRSTPLLEAIEAGDSEQILALIHQGDWNERRDMGHEAPLHLAARTGNHVAIEALLEAGVDIDSPGGRYHWTALCYAVDGGHTETVGLLLGMGARPSVGNRNGVSALHAAAAAGRPEMMRLLVESEGAVNQKTALGETPLTWACAHEQGSPAKRPEIVALLLSSGSDPNAVDASGRTPVHFAAVRPDPRLLALLLAAGGNPDGSDLDSLDPIHAAALEGLTANVRQLIAANATPALLEGKHEVNAITYRQVASIYETDGNTQAAQMAYQTAASEYSDQASLLSKRASAKELNDLLLTALAVVASGYIRGRGTEAMLQGDSTSPWISQAAMLDMQTLNGAQGLSGSDRAKLDIKQLRRNAEHLTESANDCSMRAQALGGP